MSKKIFEHNWGGEDTWYTKSKRWANDQVFPINYFALSFIEWLWEHWVDGKVEMEMQSIDKQVKEIGKIWDEEDKKNQEPIILSRPSEVEGLDEIRIIAPHVVLDISDDWKDIEINHKK
jgi:hypothetical protein